MIKPLKEKREEARAVGQGLYIVFSLCLVKILCHEPGPQMPLIFIDKKILSWVLPICPVAHSSVFPPIVKKTKKLGILRFKNPQVQLPSWEGNYKLILGILLDHVPAHCDFQKLMFCHTTVLLYRKEIGHFLVFLFPCSFPLGLREKK